MSLELAEYVKQLQARLQAAETRLVKADTLAEIAKSLCRYDLAEAVADYEQEQNPHPPEWVDTRPIPPEDLERAKEHVRESGWVAEQEQKP